MYLIFTKCKLLFFNTVYLCENIWLHKACTFHFISNKTHDPKKKRIKVNNCEISNLKTSKRSHMYRF